MLVMCHASKCTMESKCCGYLAQRVINGLEVILIRETYESGNIFWTLRVSDFKKCFQRFESKYPGGINYNFNSEEVNKSIYDWEDRLWKIFPS